MFARFFRPKWQHPKVEVRLQAVSLLQGNNPDQAKILLELLHQDSATDVRAAALARIQDWDTLTRFAGDNADSILRDVAIRRLADLLSSKGVTDGDQQGALQCLEKVSQPDVLLHIALRANALPLQQAAMERLEDDYALLKIASGQVDQSLRIQAAERINDREVLEQLLKLCQNHKRLQRTVRDKLNSYKQQEKDADQQRQQGEHLSESLEALARTGWFPHYKAKLEGISQQWQALNHAVLQSTLLQRFEHAAEQCQQVVKAELQRQEQEESARHLQQQQAEQRSALISAYTQLLEQTRSALPEQASHFSQALSQIAQRATELGMSEQTSKHHSDISNILSVWQRYAELSPQLESVLQGEETDSERLSELLKQLEWPDTLTAPNLLSESYTRLGVVKKAAREAKVAERESRQPIENKLDQMARHLKAGRSKAASRIASQLEERMQEAHLLSLQPRFAQLQEQLHELVDWQGFAIRPKKEQLIAAMQALATSPLAGAEQLARIRKYNQEWRGLGTDPTSTAQDLWQAFREASDQAFAHCQSYLEEQAALRADNLQKRQQLTTQLEEFIQSAAFPSAEGNFLEQLRHTARQQWQAYSPVERQESETLQARFDVYMEQLSDAIVSYRKQQEDAKEAIVNEAVELLSWTDIIAATRRAKTLQQDWKALGQGRRRQDQVLWQRFRECCDKLFQRRDSVLQAQKVERLERFEAANQEAERFDQVLSEVINQSRVNEEQIKTLIQQFQSLPGVLQEPRQEHVDEQLEMLEQRLLEQQHQPLMTLLQQTRSAAAVLAEAEQAILSDKAATDIEPSDTSEPLATRLAAIRQGKSAILQRVDEVSEAQRMLCIRMELLAGLDSPEQDQSLRMQYQLGKLQASMAQADKGTVPLFVQMHELELEWYENGPVINAILQNRFHSALEKAKARY